MAFEALKQVSCMLNGKALGSTPNALRYALWKLLPIKQLTKGSDANKKMMTVLKLIILLAIIA